MIVSSDHASLVAAIRATPDDDTIRLVYADFMEENDQPIRAEFIRCQIGGHRYRAMDLCVKHGTHIVTGWKWISGRPGVFPERGFYPDCTFHNYSIIRDFGDLLFAAYPLLVVNLPDGNEAVKKEFEERWEGIEFKVPPVRERYFSISGEIPQTVGIGTSDYISTSWGSMTINTNYWATNYPGAITWNPNIRTGNQTVFYDPNLTNWEVRMTNRTRGDE